MTKLKELKQCLRNYLESITTVPNLNFQVIIDIIETDISIIRMKLELRKEFAEFEQYFNIGCVYVKKIDTPIPYQINTIRLDGLTYALIHFDTLMKAIERFRQMYPHSSFKCYNNAYDTSIYFYINNFRFRNTEVVGKLNRTLHIKFMSNHKHMLNMKPYKNVALYGFKYIGYMTNDTSKRSTNPV